jgi:four helix bundle protein
MTSKELQDRLINFAVLTFELTNTIKKNPAGINLINQLVRSAASPALNYEESISAESSKDFVHKMQIVLKELRETQVSLEIIKHAALSNDSELLSKMINESNQLISIFVKSVNTAKSK